MGRRQTDSELSRYALFFLLLMGSISCCMVYLFISMVFKPTTATFVLDSDLSEHGGEDVRNQVEEEDEEKGQCCRGIEHLELWGDAVKWGSAFKLNSSEECCMACKQMCGSQDGPCLCDSWVFCGDKDGCGPRFGECWLKKQKVTLDPDRRESGDQVIWTSGLVFGKGEGTVGLETEHGFFRVQLLPDCAPHSVAYILELLASRHCAGCQIYRAESLGSYWDSEGNHLENAAFGPPYGLIQGTLKAHGTIFKEIPKEACPTIRRGSVAWIGSGPEFFISLANHIEWRKVYTVFGSVLHEDMEIVEKIAKLPTEGEEWSNISVSVLQEPVPFRFRKIDKSRKSQI